MKQSKIIALFLAIFLFAGTMLPTNYVYAGETNRVLSSSQKQKITGTKGYWSESNAPEFYGTTEIVLKQGMEFSIEDPRYRIFARDFEDFDLTQKIVVVDNPVNTQEVGNYTIKYEVTDSHENTTKLEVPVTVTADADKNPMVERTLYSLPSVDNIAAMEIYRGDRHDRQMLGVFVEQGGTIRIRRTSGGSDLTYTMLNNDKKKETSKKITTNWQEIVYENDYTPFIMTLYKQNEPVKVEIEWDEADSKVKPLNYYHQGDNEAAFFEAWRNDTNSYAVIEGEAVTILVPYADNGLILNYYDKCFNTLEEVLSYWKQVTDRYDYMLGLEYAPEDKDNQNVKSRFFVKANKNGAGAAYYATDHIGVNNESVASFFEYNWGGLHEFGHGYQGSLGKGDLSIGEVSNNVFGYYIQTDKSLYRYPGNWLGNIPDIEEKHNLEKQNGKTFATAGVDTKLYYIINFLNSFSKQDTHRAIATLYRKNAIQKNIMPTQDAWVLGIYEAHGVSVVNYFESWGIPISESVKEKLRNANAKNYYAMKDIVQDDALATKIKNDLNLYGKYQLVSNEQLASYAKTGEVTLTFAIDDFSKLKGRYVEIVDENTTIAKAKVTEETITLTGLPIGSYTVLAPTVVGEYARKNMDVVVSPDKTSSARISYEKISDVSENDVKIQFQGYYYEDAAEVTVNKTANGMNVHLRYRGTTLFNGNLAAEKEYAKIEILDHSDEVVYSKIVRGANDKFSAQNLEELDISVQEGYRIRLKYGSATKKLKFISNLNGDYRTAYEIKDNEEATYIITKDGLRKESFTDASFYEERKVRAMSYMDKLLSKMTEEQIYKKTAFANEKTSFIQLFKTLNSEDQAKYRSVVDKVLYGHIPTVSLSKTTVYAKVGDVLDLYSYIQAEDKEDGALTKDMIQIETKLDMKKAGTYEVNYIVSDSDRNQVKVRLVVIVEGKKEAVKVTLNKKSLSLYPKESYTLTAAVTPVSEKVTFKSNAPSICKVDAKGKITALKPGNAKITATVNGVSVSCNVVVKKPTTTLSSTEVVLTSSKKSRTLTATVNGKKAAGKNLTWKSSSNKLVKVDKNGKITAVTKKAVKAVITATGKNGVKAKCTVYVNPSIKLNKTSATLKVKGKASIKATVAPRKANVTYKSSDKKVAVVNSKGVVTAKKKGKAVITVEANGIRTKFKVVVK